MLNIKKRIILSFVINILMVLIFISAITSEIFDIYNNPNSVYQNVWGLFRYFTIDGNFLSFIFNIIIGFKQYQSLRLLNPRYIEEKIVTHFLYMISLISSCNEIVIFTVVMVVFLPMANEEYTIGLIGTYKASSVHITIPVLLIFRFLFLDKRKRDLKIYEKIMGGAPMCIYGTIMFILCGAKVFKSFDKKEGDGKIPYPFFDVYHQAWYFCFFIAVFIFILGFGIGILFDFLNKKCSNLIFHYDIDEIETENQRETSQNLFLESTANDGAN